MVEVEQLLKRARPSGTLRSYRSQHSPRYVLYFDLLTCCLRVRAETHGISATCAQVLESSHLTPSHVRTSASLVAVIPWRSGTNRRKSYSALCYDRLLRVSCLSRKMTAPAL